MADQAAEPAVPKRPPMPTWVKVFVGLGIAVVVLLILKLTGVVGQGHGPGRHFGMRHGTSVDAGGPADPETAARTVQIEAKDTVFEPAQLDVQAGETVSFSITNAGKAVHEFTLGDEAMQREHAQMMEHIPAGMSHDTSNSLTLEPGETKTLTWRFGDPATLEFACHQPGHYEAGMRGVLTVG